MNAHPVCRSTRGGITLRVFSLFMATLAMAGLGRSSVKAQDADGSVEATSVLARCSKILKYGSLISPSEPTKVDAVHAMGLLGDERAVPLLVEHLENESNDNLRMQIVRALGWIESKAAVAALEKALSDKYPFVRQQAAVALKKITGKEYEYDKSGLPDRDMLRELIEKRKERSKG